MCVSKTQHDVLKRLVLSTHIHEVEKETSKTFTFKKEESDDLALFKIRKWLKAIKQLLK